MAKNNINRVTALIGAGAVLDFHLPEGAIVPTTANQS